MSAYSDLMELLAEFETVNGHTADTIDCGYELYDLLFKELNGELPTIRLATLHLFYKTSVKVLCDSFSSEKYSVFLRSSASSFYRKLNPPIEEEIKNIEPIVEENKEPEKHKCYCTKFQLFNYGCNCGGI